jgi:hypothetical protein
MTQKLTPETRGQAFTLEAMFAAVLMLSAVVFALQVTAVTPLTSSTSSQQIQNQQAATANGFLVTSAERGILKTPMLMWDNTSEEWHNTDRTGLFPYGPAGTEFGDQLNKTFIEWGVAVNVDVGHYTAPDVVGNRDLNYEPYVSMGEPSDNAVTSTYRFVVYDDDVLHDAAGTPTAETLKTAQDGFYAPDADPTSNLYNTLTVKVTAWRI